jgi:hypothetical protein
VARRNNPEPSTLLAKLQRERELQDLAWLLSDQRGRRFMWRVFDISGIFRNAFTGSETFFNNGKQALGTTFLSDLMQATPEAFAVMQAEAVKQAEEDAAAAEIEQRERESDG